MKNRTALIFGANGQDGFYLTALLQQKAFNVIKISRRGNDITGDVSDFAFVERIIKEHLPEYIFHFAANSTTRHDALFENHQTICTGTLNILESVKLFCPRAKVFISGSALQFVNKGPIDEQTPFEAKSAYSVARIHSVYAARYFRQSFSLSVYVGYFFNHDSPFRTEQHINQKIVRAVQNISNGSKGKLRLGNIDVQKEFNFAGDMVEAVWKLVNQDYIFEAVLGCGKMYSIKDWIKYCFEKRNLDWAKFVTIDRNYLPEYDRLVSNPQIIMNMGWKPKVDFYNLADMMLNV